MRKLIKKLKEIFGPKRPERPLVGITFNMSVEHRTELMKIVGEHLLSLGARLKESPDADLHIVGSDSRYCPGIIITLQSSGMVITWRGDEGIEKIKNDLTDYAHGWVTFGFVGTNRPQS